MNGMNYEHYDYFSDFYPALPLSDNSWWSMPTHFNVRLRLFPTKRNNRLPSVPNSFYTSSSPSPVQIVQMFPNHTSHSQFHKPNSPTPDSPEFRTCQLARSCSCLILHGTNDLFQYSIRQSLQPICTQEDLLKSNHDIRQAGCSNDKDQKLHAVNKM